MKKKIDIPAVILAAGQGSRLLQTSVVKPMVKINGNPLISYIISNLIYAGVVKIYIIKRAEYSWNNLEQTYKHIEFIYINEEQHLGSLYSFSYAQYIEETEFICVDCDIIANSEDFWNMLNQGMKCLQNKYIDGVMARVVSPSKFDLNMLQITENQISCFDKNGIIDGERGGYVYIWRKRILDDCLDFIKKGEYSLSRYLSFIVKKYNIGIMDIDDMWDVDTLEDVVYSENRLKENGWK